ncbi:MAG: hypothetical protein AABX93_01025 [Nanoarchaeota archaeon]
MAVKGLLSILALTAGIAVATPSYADHRDKSPLGENNFYSESNTNFPVLDIVVDESLPNYLQGIRRIKDTEKDFQIQRWMETYRAHTISTLEHQTGPNLNFVNQSASFTEKIHGKDVRFILQDYMLANKVDGGKKKEVLFYNGTGGMKEFPVEEFGKIRKDLVYRIDESAKRNSEQFRGIFNEVKDKLSKRLGMSREEFERQAEELVALDGGVKVRRGAFLDYPGKDIEPIDFVPNTVIFGNNTATDKGVIHAAVNTDSGIMYLTPLSVKIEHIGDSLEITRHEMVHANRKMQNFTLNKMMDAELFASFPWLDNTVSHKELDHDYLNSLKWTVKSYMCFDIDQAREELFTGMPGPIRSYAFKTNEANLEKFRKYSKWIDAAKQTLKKAVRNSLVEFYSDPSWFGALNERLGYDNAGFDLLMSQQLEPTCLGGPGKTLEWVVENRGKIDSLWKKAIKEVDEDKKKPQTQRNLLETPQLSKIYTDFNAIRIQQGTEASENYLLAHINELVPYLKDISPENLGLLKKNLRTKDNNTKSKVLGVLEGMSLDKKIDNIK